MDARRIALVSTAAVAAILLGWKWAGAAAAGPGALAVLLAVAAPPAALAAAIAAGRPRGGRVASLVLPFYAAGFLTEALADPASRAWATAGAFATALAFASVIGWVRRAAGPRR